MNFVFINFLICLLIFLPAIVILVSLKGNKPYKVKEDILFIEKLVLKCLLLSFFMLLFLYELLKSDEKDEQYNYYVDIIFLIKIITFNIYIIILFMNNFFLCLEDYFTYINPLHYFNSLFHRAKSNILYEFISIIIPIIISAILLFFNNFDVISNSTIIINNSTIFSFFNINYTSIIDNIGLMDNSYSSNSTNTTLPIYKNINDESPFIIFNCGILIVIGLVDIIIIILYIALKCKIKKIIFRTREKLLVILNRKIIASFFYFIFVSFNGTFFFLYKKQKEEQLIKNLRKVNSFLFLFVYLVDGFLEFKTYSTSKFTKYKLKYTIVDSIGSCFSSKDQEEDIPTNTYVDSMIQEASRSSNTKTANDYYDDTDEETSLLLPMSSTDAELVLIYRNKIYIEDYFFYYYDYIMNVTLSALIKIYKNKKFSPSAENNRRLKNELNITESEIFEGDKSANTYTSNDNSKKIDNIIDDDNIMNNTFSHPDHPDVDMFEYVRNSLRNDFKNSEEIFTNTLNDCKYDDLKIRVTSYFTSKCVSNIFDKNFTSKIISDSLKSHLDFDNNKNNSIGGGGDRNAKFNKNNISCENNFSLPYHSIISCNAKEEYFLHLKNMVIKTYDKQLTFDIFETNDDDINNNSKSNKKLVSMLDEYFNYIKGVGVSGTFLPVILGIFKVKINSFKTMLIYMSCNSLLENSPSNNYSYSYWQLIRFSSNKTDKVASSKYRHNILLGDDLIFDRKEALPSIKGINDYNYNKIEVKNFLNFEETINHDIVFLNKVGVYNTDLLMMYFEYENTQKHEQGGAIKIRKTDNNKAEIVNTTITMPIVQDDEDESDENIYMRDFSKKQDSENATIPTITIQNSNKSNKVSSNLTNKISVLNANIKMENIENENKDNNENEIIKTNDNDNDIDGNLDIAQSLRDNEKELCLKKSSNDGFNSGSLNNMDEFLNEAMMSFDEPVGSLKKPLSSNNILNYSEKVKINSYDGYFDDFNCMCLFSFENIFELNSGGCCSCCSCCNSFNYNKLKDNIFLKFCNYFPRKHTGLVIRKKSKKKNE